MDADKIWTLLVWKSSNFSCEARTSSLDYLDFSPYILKTHILSHFFGVFQQLKF